MPSRIATFLIDAGFRPVAFAASSNDFEARANSIKRRCSANEKPGFRTIIRNALCDLGQSRQAGICSLGDFAFVVRTEGNCPVRNR
jgi:hypothetical protein